MQGLGVPAKMENGFTVLLFYGTSFLYNTWNISPSKDLELYHV